MNIKGKPYHTIWMDESSSNIINIIDQRYLPHEFKIEQLKSVNYVARAIKEMHLRGAPLIGVAAAYGMYLASMEAPNGFLYDDYILKSAVLLKQTRPTAVNLAWAVGEQMKVLESVSDRTEKTTLALRNAHRIKADSIERCRMIGVHGLSLIEDVYKRKKETVNILTHCNAGWLACVDYGTATAPIYKAHEEGIPVHVWVDETRPRNQGARLTAFELLEHGVPHTVISDNVGGHLMQHNMVDMVIVGTDRTTYTGDVANKIGTYLKALAAKDNNIPFYVALPSSTIDWEIEKGEDIPIEQRGSQEVKYIQGLHDNRMKKVLLTPRKSAAANFAFDVTPARLVSKLITEKGICSANQAEIQALEIK